MNKILELREKRAKAWETAKAFLDTRRGTDGLISADDTATYDKMEADVIALGKEIERLEKQEALDIELSKPLNSPLMGKPQGAPEAKTGKSSEAYKTAFWNALRTNGAVSPEIRNALQVGTPSEGGYLVPDEYEKRLIETLNDVNVFRSLASTVQTGGDRIIPLVTSKGTADWIDEEGDYGDVISDPAFDKITLGAHKLGTMIKVSEELLQDSVFDLPSYLAAEFARRIGAKEEQAFNIGDGSKKPTGIFHATGGATVGKTTATASAITADELVDLVYALRAPYRKNAKFLMNDLTIKNVRKLKDGTGTYLWQPSMQAGEPDTLLGYPVFTSVYTPEIAASAKVIAFGDFSYYWIADRQGRVFKRLNELYAQTGQVGFMASQRVDGKLLLPEAIQVLQMHS